MKKVLVAGASGHLGKAVLEELRKQGGYTITSLVRNEKGKSELQDLSDRIVVGDATDSQSLRNVCDNIDVVFSALGASPSLSLSKTRQTFRDVDYQANKNLLEAALRANVQKFVYVSVFGAEKLKHLEYIKAHEDFVGELQLSGLSYAVVRPNGLFYVLSALVDLAQSGFLSSFGNARSNPIHAKDMAVVCVDAINDNQTEYSAGGQEIYTRNEINQLAFAALGKKGRIIKVPVWLGKTALLPLRIIDPRLYEMMRFVIDVSNVDIIAPKAGTHSFSQFFRDYAQRKQ